MAHEEVPRPAGGANHRILRVEVFGGRKHNMVSSRREFYFAKERFHEILVCVGLPYFNLCDRNSPPGANGLASATSSTPPDTFSLAKSWMLHAIDSRLITAILLFSSIPAVCATVSAADEGDDFANNLFTDLAPILALFGEQVAKQFLSESSGWADNILFAMAPLGIITGIVSAIRVAGNPILKAIVGRGKEGRAQVELELMSSNSPDVGEMWNGQSIVRVLGTPSIFQLIYAPDRIVSDPTGSIDVLDNSNNPFFQRVPGKKTEPTIALTPAPQTPADFWVEDYDIELPERVHDQRERLLQANDETCPPNIALNARGEPVSKSEKWLMAAVGITVQLIVLIFDILISYHPAWKKHFLKNGSRPSKEALPFTITGTIALNLGMLLCSYVIDEASVEEKWILKNNQSETSSETEQSTSCQVAWIQKGGTVNDQEFEPYIIIGHEGQQVIRTSRRCHKNIAIQLPLLVSLATFISIPGFVVQFIGLRGMHWSATIAQLAATLFMTIVRSFVRRRLVKEPEAIGAFEGYELDCMARKIGNCDGWKVVSGYPSGDAQNDDGLGDRVLQVRKRLGELAKWPMEVEETSRALCAAMERTMNTIFSSQAIQLLDDASQLKELSWKLVVLTFGGAPSKGRYEELKFKIQRSQYWESWKLSDDEQRRITSVLSLWMRHFKEEDSQNPTPAEDDDRKPRASAKVLVWPNHNIDLELFKLWIGYYGGKIRYGYPKNIARSEKIPRYRFIGTHGMCRDFSNPQTITIIPNASTEKLFAQQIFSDFFSAVVPLIKDISGTTKIYHDDQNTMQEIRSTALSQLVQAISETGLGTQQEILMNIVPLLGCYGKLPIAENSPSALILQRLRMKNHWHKVASEIKRLTEVASQKGDRDVGKLEAQQMATRFCKRILAMCPTETGPYGKPDHPQQLFWNWLDDVRIDDLPPTPNHSQSEDQCIEIPASIGENLSSLATQKIRRLLAPFGRIPLVEDNEMLLLKESMHVETERDLAQVLKQAVTEGYYLVVEAIIDRKFNMKAFGRGAESLLALAAARGHTTVLEFLLNQFLWNYPHDYQHFQVGNQPIPLWNAARYGHSAAVQQLLKHISSMRIREVALTLAAWGGHIEVVKELLGAETNINPVAKISRGYNRKWLLVKGVEPDQWTRVEFLGTEIAMGTNLNHLAKPTLAIDRCYEDLLTHFERSGKVDILLSALSVRTPLQAAAEGGHIAVVDLLLRAGANMDSKLFGLSWRTTLQAAAEGGHLGVVERLLEAGAIVNAEPSPWAGRTALQAASQGGYLDIINRLVQFNANVNASGGHNYGRTALQVAAEGGHSDVVNRLLEIGALVNADPSWHSGRTALQAAAEGGHLDVVERLLEVGALVNANPSKDSGRTALQAAAEGGHLDVVEKLLEVGALVNADPSHSGRTALNAAAGGGHLDVVERLLEVGALVNPDPSERSGRTALQAAAGGGHLDVVERLLEVGADVNANPSSYSGRTALQAAAGGGHLDVVERLLEVGALVNTNPSTFSGRTALQAAAEGGHLDVVERLLEVGALVNPDPSERSGRTALQAAAEGGHLDVVERLLEVGALVNANPSAEYGRTALQAAAGGGHLDVVEKLLEVGALVNADPSHSGRTALQAAIQAGHNEVAARLREVGAT